jgi:hypothetical protein
MRNFQTKNCPKDKIAKIVEKLLDLATLDQSETSPM